MENCEIRLPRPIGVLCRDEHVVGKQAMPRPFGENPNAKPILRMCPTVAIAHVKRPPLQIRKLPCSESSKTLRWERTIDLAPPYMLPTGGLLHDEFILRTPTRVRRRADYQRPVSGKNPLTITHGMLIKLRWAEIIIDHLIPEPPLP